MPDIPPKIEVSLLTNDLMEFIDKRYGSSPNPLLVAKSMLQIFKALTELAPLAYRQFLISQMQECLGDLLKIEGRPN